jgi:Ca2+-binding RTX toxin-like protein
VESGTLFYYADPNEANRTDISRNAGRLVIRDPGLNVTVTAVAGGGCTSVNSNEVSCEATGVQDASIWLDDLEDELTLNDAPQPLGLQTLVANGEAGNDTLRGGIGSDTLRGGPDEDHLFGGGGNDGLEGDEGPDELDGGEGADSLTGADANDTLRGGPGGDQLFGGLGDDTEDGGEGNDGVEGNPGFDLVGGGPGDDQLDVNPDLRSDAADGPDVLDGGPGADVLGAGATPAPAATPPPPQDPDIFDGGDGIDTADYSTRTEPLTIALNGKNDDGESGEHDNVLPGTECVDGGSDDDMLIGSSAADCLDGHDGEDTIWGRGGDDMLEGGRNDPSGDNLIGENGDDTMQGGSGDDSLVGGEGDDYELGEGGGDRVEGEAGNDRLLGGAGADVVDGGEGNDLVDGGAFLLIGGDGPDELIGGPDDDTLFGRRGNDRLDGGGGSDSMSGGSERDTVTYEERTNRVFVTLDDKANDGERGERDNVQTDVEIVLGGIQDDNVFGDADADMVEAGRGEDLLDGRLGRDRLGGGDAPDVVLAHDGAADDVICGDARDLAIADGRDKVIDCETIDRPGERGPIVGRYARVRRDGEFRLQLPQGRRFFPLDQNVKIPFGSTVDPPKEGAVRLVTARNRAGGRQVASVSLGRFGVDQEGGRRPVTELRLAGRLPDCRGSSKQRAKRAARSSPRRLRVEVGKPGSAAKISERAGLSAARGKRHRGGNVRVRGRYSWGASFGTEWLTEERCNGTFTKVISGSVRVRDFGLRQFVTVRPGKPHLARSG